MASLQMAFFFGINSCHQISGVFTSAAEARSCQYVTY